MVIYEIVFSLVWSILCIVVCSKEFSLAKHFKRIKRI